MGFANLMSKFSTLICIRKTTGCFVFLVLLSVNTSAVDTGVRRSDLFLQAPYFLGLPPSADDYDDGTGMFSNRIPIDRVLSVSVGDDNKKDTEEENLENWPGHVSTKKVTNPGADVVEAYKANFEQHKDEYSHSTFTGRAEGGECKDQAKCDMITSAPTKALCTLQCSLNGAKGVNEVHMVLYQTVKSLCYTIETFFSQLDTYNIKSLDKFKIVIQNLPLPANEMRQVAVRAMLVKLIDHIASAVTPFRPILKHFTERLKTTERTLKTQDKVLIGNHPGCSMIDLKEALEMISDVLKKNPALQDYVLFHGFALFSGVTKYVEDFKSKVHFAVLSQAFGMMLGTNCGIVNYGITGEKTFCDQYGRYPQLNMPIPRSMWSSKTQKACLKALKNAKLNGANGAADVSKAPTGTVKRRRRSLTVGRKRTRT